MAATGFTPISLYYTTTAAAVPVNTNLVAGELALNTTDGKLYYKDTGGTVQLLASNATTTNVSSITFGTTGLTPATATSGAVTVAGRLVTANGGTNLASFTSGGAMYATSTSVLTTGTLPVSAGGTGITSFGTGVATFLGTPSSANLAAAVTGETGSGALVFGTSPTLTTPVFSSIVNTGTLTLPTSTDTLVGRATTDTLTNKRITARVNTQTTTTSPWAWNSDSFDQQEFTALANALTINADAGTPTDGQKTVFRFQDNGTARALTWTTGTSKSFRAIGVTLPTTTVIGKTVYIGCIYNSGDARWDAVAVAQEI